MKRWLGERPKARNRGMKTIKRSQGNLAPFACTAAKMTRHARQTSNCSWWLRLSVANLPRLVHQSIATTTGEPLQPNNQIHIHCSPGTNIGFPIASGTIESGVKQYKHRLAGPGKRWSRSEAKRMMTIRSSVLNRSFNRLWQAA